MNIAARQWTLGILIGLPLLFLLVVLIATAGTMLAFYFDNRSYDSLNITTNRQAATLTIIGTSVILAIIVISSVIGYWPLQSEYHQYRQVNGTVAKISSRFVGGANSTNQKFVVVLTSGSQQYGITDTRASLLKPGDRVTLRCIRVYEYGSNDAGYECKWGQ